MKKRVFRNVLGLALAAVMTVSAAMPALAARGPDTAYETLAESHVTQATLPRGTVAVGGVLPGLVRLCG